MAPTARVRTLRLGDESSGSTAGTAPSSRTKRRPSFWKQMDWMAPAAFACSYCSGSRSSATSGGTPPCSMMSVTFSRS